MSTLAERLRWLAGDVVILAGEGAKAAHDVTDEARDERGRWTDGGGSGEALKLYHLTNDPKFALNPTRALTYNNTVGGPDKLGLFAAADPEPWVNGYDYVRPFLAELTVPKSALDDAGAYPNEHIIPAANYGQVTVDRVIPLDAYVREHYGDYGWVEEHHGTAFDTGDPLPERGDGSLIRPVEDYHYDGPDVRDMPKEETDRQKARVVAYLVENRGFTRAQARSALRKAWSPSPSDLKAAHDVGDEARDERGRWTASGAVGAADLAALNRGESLPEDHPLAMAIDRYTTNMILGGPLDEAVAHAPAGAPELWRGMIVSREDGEKIVAELRAGTLQLPLSSWSRDELTAVQFAGPNADTGMGEEFDRAGGHPFPMLFRLEAGARALNLEPNASREWGHQREWMTPEGRYEVAGAVPGIVPAARQPDAWPDRPYEVTLRQVAAKAASPPLGVLGRHMGTYGALRLRLLRDVKAGPVDEPRDERGRWTAMGAQADAWNKLLTDAAGPDAVSPMKVGQASTRIPLREAVASTIAAQADLPVETVTQFLHSWDGSSSDFQANSLALQQAISERFDVPLTREVQAAIAVWAPLEQGIRYVTDPGTAMDREVNVQQPWGERVDDAALILDATYAATQARLAEAGLAEVTLFRGVRWNDVPPELAEAGKPGFTSAEVTVRGLPGSSWSLSPTTAAGFATLRPSAEGWAVLVATVPADRVISLPMTGFGVLGEREATVLGSPMTATAYGPEGLARIFGNPAISASFSGSLAPAGHTPLGRYEEGLKAFDPDQPRDEAGRWAGIRLYHGTNTVALERAVARGSVAPLDPHALSNEVEAEYGLPRDSVWGTARTGLNTFSHGRQEDPNVYLTADPRIAEMYARIGSEVLDDTLGAAYRTLHPYEGDRTGHPDGDAERAAYGRAVQDFKDAWMERHGMAPVVLHVDVPREAVARMIPAGSQIKDPEAWWAAMTGGGRLPNVSHPGPVPMAWVSHVERPGGKVAAPAGRKGDLPGHAFRGNQWTGSGVSGLDKIPEDRLLASPGTTPVAPGMVRLYHYTKGGEGARERLASIRDRGILKASAIGERYGEPNMVWASAQQPRPDAHYVEFHASPEQLVNGPGSPGRPATQEAIDTFMARGADSGLFGDVTPEQIVSVHEPWHDHYRYIAANPGVQAQIASGDLRPGEGLGASLDKAITAWGERHPAHTKGDLAGHPFRGNQYDHVFAAADVESGGQVIRNVDWERGGAPTRRTAHSEVDVVNGGRGTGERVFVGGSRNYRDLGEVYRAVAALPADAAVLTSATHGASAAARQAALDRGLELQVWSPVFDQPTREAAFFARDREVVDASDRVLSFYDGRSVGTAHEVAYAREAGKPVEQRVEAAKAAAEDEPRDERGRWTASLTAAEALEEHGDYVHVSEHSPSGFKLSPEADFEFGDQLSDEEFARKEVLEASERGDHLVELTRPEDRLAVAAELWTEDRWGMTVQAARESAAAGTPNAVARELLMGIRESPPTEVPLYRGLILDRVGDEDPDSDAHVLGRGLREPGTVVSLGLDSFSSDERPPVVHDTRLIIPPGVRALPLAHYSSTPSEDEYVVAGNFEVTGHDSSTTVEDVWLRPTSRPEGGKGVLRIPGAKAGPEDEARDGSGRWTSGGGSADPTGMRRVAPGARFWHVTDDPDFKPSAMVRPASAGGADLAASPTLYGTSSPFYWSNVSGGGGGPWTAGRPYAAELEVLPGHPVSDPPQREDPLQPQVILDPDHVRVTRVVPLADAIAEETGYDQDGHWVGRVVARPIDPRGKAAHDVSDEERDDHGRWTAGGTASDQDVEQAGLRYFQDHIPRAPWPDSGGPNPHATYGAAALEDVVSDSQAVQQSVRDAVVSDIAARSGVDPGAVRTFVDTWYASSAGSYSRSIALQQAVALKFGLPDAATTGDRLVDKWFDVVEQDDRGVRVEQKEEVGALVGDAAKVADAIYASTQESLASDGVSELLVYRGLNFVAGEVPDELALGRTDNVVTSEPATSWTLSAPLAGAFAGADDENLAGRVLEARVPAERVFSLPFTGVGSLRELEVVLVGGPMRVKVSEPGWQDEDEAAAVAAGVMVPLPAGKAAHDVSDELRDEAGRWTTGGTAEQRAVLARIEPAIRGLPQEQIHVLGRDGSEVFTRQGDANHVPLTLEEIRAWRDGAGDVVITHNHPTPTAFSLGDINTAIYADAAEVRAVTRFGTYVLAPDPEARSTVDHDEKGWPAPWEQTAVWDAFSGARMRAYDDYLRAHDPGYQAAIVRQMSDPSRADLASRPLRELSGTDHLGQEYVREGVLVDYYRTHPDLHDDIYREAGPAIMRDFAAAVGLRFRMVRA